MSEQRVLLYDSKPYDIEFFKSVQAQNNNRIQFDFVETKLDERTCSLAKGYRAISLFVHDIADEAVLNALQALGVEIIALRCAGFNNINIKHAKLLNIKVVRVPEYSPYAVAEHALALIMVLNRKIHKAFNRVRENNFSLNGLIGFDIHNKKIGVIGTGKIGQIFIKLMKGFDSTVLAYDIYPNQQAAEKLGFEYVSLNELYAQCDIISLHAPLTRETSHLIDSRAIASMKPGVVIINTSRGKLIDSNALIDGLKSGKVKAAGLDVYEEEEAFFFEDHSDHIIQDDNLARLIGFNNVIVTSHQAFFTEEAMTNIADTTFRNLEAFFAGDNLTNIVEA